MNEDQLELLWAETLPDADLQAGDPAATYKPAAEPDKLDLVEAFLETFSSGATTDGSSETLSGSETLGEGKAAETFSSGETVDGGEAETAPSTPAPAPGPGPASTFSLVEEVGRGGMGVVFRARQESLQRTVAIKQTLSGAAGSAATRRFVSEALVTGLLDHPNVVPVHELSRGPSGEAMLAMKLVDGTEWKDLLHPRDGEAPRSFEEHVEILIKVCNAISYAHSKGIAHLDLKPENVMVGSFGEVYVMDWGIAVDLREGREGEAPRTQPKSRITGPCGTPSYMAPELADGRGEDISERTDVYLLGAILHEVVTSRPPHRGPTLLKVLLHAAESPPPVFESDVPEELQGIIRRALARHPEDRTASAALLEEELRAFLKHRESGAVAARARETLEACRTGALGGRDELYGGFAAAIAGFQNAVLLWEGNARAREDERAARLDYARAALGRGDVGLAESQLARLEDHPEVPALREEAARLEAERARSEKAARRQKLIIGGAVAAVLMVTLIGLYSVNAERKLVEEKNGELQETNAKIEAQLITIKVQSYQNRVETLIARASEVEGAVDRAWDLRSSEERSEACRLAVRAASTVARGLARTPDAPATASPAVQAATAQLASATASLRLSRQRAELLAERIVADRRLRDFGSGWRVALTNAAFLPAGRIFAGFKDGALAVWGAEDAPRRIELEARLWRAFPSPDGSAALCVFDDDPALHLRDLGSGERRQVFRGLPAQAFGACFSPDGSRVLAWTDKVLKMWDVRTGALLADFAGHSRDVYLALFSPDGQTVLSKGRNSVQLRFWDLSGRPLRVATPPRINDLSLAIAWSPDGKRLAYGGFQELMLWSPDEAKLIRRIKTGDPVSFCGFSPNGSQVYAATGKGIRFWDAASGEPGIKLEGLARYPIAVDFDHEGKRFLAAGPGDLIVWSARDGQVSRRLDAHAGRSSCAVFSPDGREVLAAWDDGGALVYDRDSGRSLQVFEGHPAAVRACAFSPDGRRALTASDDASLRLWNREDGALIRELRGHKGPVLSCRFNPTGDRIASGSADGTAIIWNVKDGSALAELGGHGGAVNALAFSPDGALLAAASESGIFVLWDARSFESRRAYKGHSAAVTCLDFIPNGQLLLSGSKDKTVRLWDSASEQCFASLAIGSPVRDLAASAENTQCLVLADKLSVWGLMNRKQLAQALTGMEARGLDLAADAVSVVLSGSSKAWEGDVNTRVRTRPGPRVLSSLLGHSGEIRALDLSPDGRRVLSVGADGSQRLWDAGSGRQLFAFTRHVGNINALACRADGAILASGSDDKTVKLWDRETRAIIRTLSGHDAKVFDLAFAPNKRRLVSASFDRTLRIWDTDSGGTLHTLRGHEAVVTACAFSPDGRRVLSGSADGQALVWKADEGVLERRLDGHASYVLACAFSPTGDRLLTGSADRSLRIWEADTGRLIQELTGHEGPVWSAAYSPDGALIASASSDRSIRIWDGRSGAPLRVLTGHRDEVRSLGFTADGALLLSGSFDKTLAVWDPVEGERRASIEVYNDEIWACALTPDGAELFAGGLRIHSYRKSSGRRPYRPGSYFGEFSECFVGGFEDEGRSVLLGVRGLRSFGFDGAARDSAGREAARAYRVKSLARSLDESLMLAVPIGGHPLLYESRSGKLLGTYSMARSVVTGAIAPGGEELLLCEEGRLWRIERSGRVLAKIELYGFGITCACYAPEGDVIAVGGKDLVLIDRASGEVIRRLSAHDGGVRVCAFSPDGLELLTGGADGVLRVWERRSGCLIRTLEGHGQGITAARFSRDGRRILSGDGRGQVFLWEHERRRRFAEDFAGYVEDPKEAAKRGLDRRSSEARRPANTPRLLKPR